MSNQTFLVSAAAVLCTTGLAPAGDEWVNFVDETSSRLVSDPAVGAADEEEKDYAWGDLDQDGDDDLVCVRKVPFTNPGGKTNVLFMNEGIADGHGFNGKLVDRTGMWATDADDGGQGFMDLTNDRDVVIVDLNNDTWLDVVTATTLSDGLPKTISHPRVYINKGEIGGIWQGLRYEEARTPQLYTISGNNAQPPRFCSVAAGDVTGDGRPELYFGDYDSSGAGGQQQDPGEDINDRLFINDGNGFFTDSLENRMTSTMLLSAFGTAVAIADMNGDGVNDVVKDTGLNNPTRVSISYNDDTNEGVFDNFQVVYGNSPYFISVGDLNSDGLLDIVITDDGTDRYLLNTGNDGSGQAQFNQFQFPSGPSAGFGSNSVIADLNNDGHNDVIIADVDVDISGCSNRIQIYRNLGDTPNVTLTVQGEVIPNAMSNGGHDVAVLDINRDGWLDMVYGRCESTEIWINQSPQGLVYQYPSGLPSTVIPDQTTDFQVRVGQVGGADPADDTGILHTRVPGGGWVQTPMPQPVPGGSYFATLPAVPCTEKIDWYVSSEDSFGTMFFDPPAAPAATYTSQAQAASIEKFRDEMEEDPTPWSVENDPSLTGGGWEIADPNGTIIAGDLAAPDDDATNGSENVRAFVTENGPPGAENYEQDVDGGPTRLISPRINLSGTDAVISFLAWVFQSESGDQMSVALSNDDGQTYSAVVDIADTDHSWQVVSFVVSDFVTPTADVRVRFSISDELTAPDSSVVEAGVDDFSVDETRCSDCPGDCNGDGVVDVTDLLASLAEFNQASHGTTCLSSDGTVDINELLEILGVWGPCP